MAMNGFTVDPRIFRELGELLVRRDSIALTELLKNAYDADAEFVHVLGEGLDGRGGSILVTDDGVGMTSAQFRNGFLRIASRTKETEDRRSPLYGRRYTGEKGIGRLSAHKLGAVLDVHTTALSNEEAKTGTRFVRARIDWDRIEESRSLDDLGEDALSIRRTHGRARPSGTTLRIGRLREVWNDRELRDFVIEADQFEPPGVLLEPVDALVSAELLFARPRLRDTTGRGSRFEVDLGGDFEIGESLWQTIPDAAWWVLEIDSTRRRVRYAMAPTQLALHAVPEAVPEAIELAERDPRRPEFQARMFLREGVGDRRDRQFATQIAGIRIYMEGFRIFPYGERTDDWLGLDEDYARRADKLGLDIPQLRGQYYAEREGLRTLPNRSYVGAVLLTHSGAPDLQAPVNREGFLPSEQFRLLRDTVRVGIDLLTRMRARLGVAEGIQRSNVRTLQRDASRVFLADELVIREGLSSAVETARTLRTSLAAARVDTDTADDLVDELQELTEAAERSVGDRALLRVLAAAGTQMAAFVHEIENLVSATGALDTTLGRLIDRHPDAAESLRAVRRNVAAIRRQVERQAGYLTDVATVEARRRRRRLPLSERLERAWSLVAPAAERLGVTFETEIPTSVRTPPMFPAEVTTVLTNLLTNAVKAAGRDGRVAASGGRDDEGTWVRVENTGTAVELRQAEKWFLPFESTTLKRIDPLLGQGMGLGLPITRSVLGDYRATIRFVEPSDGMATAVEIRFP